MKHFILLAALALLATGCANKAQSGAGLGALTGATIGALASKNKISGAAIGAGIGMAAGYIVGNEMDKTDRQQVSNTLENTPSGQVTQWRNPDTGVNYQARPRPAREHDGRVYREVELLAEMPNGKKETVYADAYRGPDGRWHLVQ
ncbi:glycine zipper domain-containing protein [Salidesulfovibrio onnuriiensis]|uniref:glycine zipper domain-containing protein n=1 Tax=Salidesulfovibrio onnuriiensis TaxID=2583823 RepID=UPI0011CC65CE|nr:glycine zipper domain-containing protein [Salidesulfovibrio onnuriiensis]